VRERCNEGETQKEREGERGRGKEREVDLCKNEKKKYALLRLKDEHSLG